MRRFDKSIVGLMEQCDNGRWVPYEDIPDYTEQFKLYEQQIKSLENKLQIANTGVDTWKNVYLHEIDTSQKLSRSNAIMSVVLLIAMTIFIGALSILTATIQHS